MNLLVTGAWNIEKKDIHTLEQMGHSVVIMKQEKDELPCSYHWVEGTVCNGLFLSHPIRKFENLKYIQLTSAGFDRAPIGFVREHGIEIHNAGNAYSVPMAEFVVAKVLQVYKRSSFFAENQKGHRWVKHRGLLELDGKTVGIVGCGSVGAECAKRFSVFGCKVIGINRTMKKNNDFWKIVGMGELDHVLSELDILVLALPLTEETRYMMNARRFGKLKNGAVFVNIARGALVDSEALTQNLWKLGGVILDVFEEEPLDEKNLLWDAGNVLITPHNSFAGENNQRRLSDIIMNNLRLCGR